jgi:hypothetical protein
MHRSRVLGARTSRLLAAASLLGLVAWLALAGCQEGRAPYEVIPAGAPPEGYLPPGGSLPGTSRTLGSMYRFDSSKYRLFPPLPGTDPRYVKRDSVLALQRAGFPGAPESLRLRPDRSDPVLAGVYADPRLFGWVRGSAADSGFIPGLRASGAAAYFPVQVGNWWEFNHNQRQWMAVDSIVGAGAGGAYIPTAGGMPVFHLRTTATTLHPWFDPGSYSADIYGTAAADTGIFFHGWTLIAERVVPLSVRQSPSAMPDRQRNPRWLWLSLQSIASFTGDPNANIPATIDQCLDALPGHLESFPVKFCGADLQEGEIFTTWTYLSVETPALRQRLNAEADSAGGGRCGYEIELGRDTLRMFPTRSFRLLCSFEVRTERLLDQIELKIGTSTIGRYPRVPQPRSVVKFVVTMSLSGASGRWPVQFLELYYLRDIGEVIRTTGVNSLTRSNARLRSCTVNGVYHPPTDFAYSDQ